MSAVHELVVATGNRGKLAELRALLAGLPVTVRGMQEVVSRPIHIVEDGATFEENALKKARAVAGATMLLTLADDSGLEVDVLDGRPGVRSARFAGEGATDAENNAELLRSIASVAEAAPGTNAVPCRARFRCALALVDPLTGAETVVEGRLEGAIISAPRGSGGFGYDPLFVVEKGERTLAELGDDAKNGVSHRARAAAQLLPELQQIIDTRTADVRRIDR